MSWGASESENRSAKAVGAVLLLATAALAGCLTSDSPDGNPSADETPAPAIVPGGPYDVVTTNPVPDGPTHAHADPAQHEGAANIELLDFDDTSDQESGMGELDIEGDWLYQCVHGDGFLIYDISNRSNPVLAGNYSGESCPDLKVTPDNQLVVLGGAYLIDVSDKSRPAKVFEYGAGCHMCAVHVIANETYVFMAQSLRGSVPDDAPSQGYVEIARIVRGATPADSTMEHVADYKADPLTYPNTHLPDADVYEFSIHDMYLYDDPIDDKPYMVVAHWDMGVRFVDVSDPAHPAEIAVWDDFKGDCGDIHTVDVEVIDGKRLVAAATENGIIIDPICSLNRWSWGFVYLIDMTDLDNPVTLGKWHVPGVQPSEPFPRQDQVPPSIVGLYSAHNLHMAGGRVYEAMYHGGVWVIDAAGLLSQAASPADILLRTDHVPTAGYYFPTCDAGGPNVWEVAIKDGFLYASDITCGLFTLHFAGDALYDPALTSDA